MIMRWAVVVILPCGAREVFWGESYRNWQKMDEIHKLRAFPCIRLAHEISYTPRLCWGLHELN